MIDKAGNLRWGNGGNRTHAVQVKRMDLLFTIQTQNMRRYIPRCKKQISQVNMQASFAKTSLGPFSFPASVS
jgi:hypothetical protein